jgi:hypothetical protein
MRTPEVFADTCAHRFDPVSAGIDPIFYASVNRKGRAK